MGFVLIAIVVGVVVLSILSKRRRGTLFFWQGRSHRDT